MRRHSFDPISMILGAVFTLVGVTFVVGDVNVANLPPALTWPVPLVVVGLAVIALAVGGSRSDRTQAAAEAPRIASDHEPMIDHPVDETEAADVGAHPTEPADAYGSDVAGIHEHRTDEP